MAMVEKWQKTVFLGANCRTRGGQLSGVSNGHGRIVRAVTGHAAIQTAGGLLVLGYLDAPLLAAPDAIPIDSTV